MPVLCAKLFQPLTLFYDSIYSHNSQYSLTTINPQLGKSNFLFPVTAAAPFSDHQSVTAITTYLTPYKTVLSYKTPARFTHSCFPPHFLLASLKKEPI